MSGRIQRAWTRKKVFTIASVLWAILIFFASTDTAEKFCLIVLTKVEALLLPEDNSPPSGVPEDHFWAKKSVHVMLFVVLSYLLTNSLGGTGRRVLLATIVLGAATGGASELIQLGFPGREARVRDFLINCASVSVGALMFSRTVGNRSKP